MKALVLLRDAFYHDYPAFSSSLSNMGVEVKEMKDTDKGINRQLLLRRVADVDIIIVAVVQIDREVIDAAKQLRFILKFGAGIDNIDVPYAQQKGIAIANAPGQNATSVAELAFAFMHTLARQVHLKNEQVKQKKWQLSLGTELYQANLGIIGYGAISRQIIQRAKGYEMKVLVYSKHANRAEGIAFVTLAELLAHSDFIILATSLTVNNAGMINKEVLQKMKAGAFLINVARGGLIVEDDLREALLNGTLAGAGLDVFNQEPPTNDLPTLANVIATPHIGGATRAAIFRTGQVTLDNVQRILNNDALHYQIKEISDQKLS
ncbi:D-3-phosphoglycerate dehydrogenase [Amphibacillus marinus]|uniref:D-3-phosphoglycerate dehydrogenase n=1 Tax=Amphibacillus marinus TaxID=872970 RepID=A0A1H8NAN4_9BACI|nr:NAD(P)-dependent oxidoreductase [Amphibacillus marinus]SEO26637.1 D-3-phosphoglycerate dehydrogenase [Amphibacillus marinus]